MCRTAQLPDTVITTTITITKGNGLRHMPQTILLCLGCISAEHGMSLLSFLAFVSSYTVDMALEIAVIQQPRQNQLHICGHSAGIEA